MSDNPADSLRRELEAAASRVLHGGEAPGITRDTCSACRSAEAVVAAVTPLIRAQAFTEAADKLEASGGIIGCARAIDPVLIDLQVVAHNPVQGEAMHKVIGYTAARYCAGLVRGLGEEAASVDSKIN